MAGGLGQLLRAVVIAATLVFSSGASGQSLTAPPLLPVEPVGHSAVDQAFDARVEPPRDRQHRVSVTLSPFHLMLLMVELTGEFRVRDRLGAAAVVGVGLLPGPVALELGGQVHYYLLGSFMHGLQVGGEVLMVTVPGSSSVRVVDLTVLVSPYLGYKIATELGFTFQLQAGPSMALVGSSSTFGLQTSSATHTVGLMANLNLGWSF